LIESVRLELTLEKETSQLRTTHPMNADVLTTRVADGIAVITLGSARRIYFDAEMGNALTEALDGFAGDAKVRVVVVTGGAPGYFNRHFNIPALIEIAESLPRPEILWRMTSYSEVKLQVWISLDKTRLF
jgi:enoyl-CoA hydratase/carnithine racemase